MACLFSERRLRPDDQGTTFSADVKVINLFATVRNKQGQIIHNLAKDDFLLEEDGQPQTIRYFSQQSDLPLTVGLLVDTSMSQRRLIGQERSASYQFFDRVLREGKDVAFVLHFEGEVELLQDLTSSRRQLESALALLAAPAQRQGGGGGGGRYPTGGGAGPYPSGRGRRGGGTALYDAVLLASDEVIRKQSGRKALIVLSDGVDNASKVTLADGIRSAHRADTLVYSILFADEQGYNNGGGGGFGGPRMGRRGGMGGGGMGGPRGGRVPMSRPDGRKILEQLSRETGGAFFEVSKKLPIEKVFDRIEEDLRNQYSLGYSSNRTDAGPGFRGIHLATRQKDLLVQTRDGYYAGR